MIIIDVVRRNAISKIESSDQYKTVEKAIIDASNDGKFSVQMDRKSISEDIKTLLEKVGFTIEPSTSGKLEICWMDY